MMRSIHELLKLDLLRGLLPGLCLLMFMSSGQAQILVQIIEPEASAGSLEFRWSGTADPAWGADLNILANAVQEPVVRVGDGTEADSLGCSTLVDPGAIAGNIALIYRGDCEFGTKAFNAQAAGAAGVIIINNIEGPPLGMGVGALGDQVIIPVVMLSMADGAMLRTLMEQGQVIIRIGTIVGLYPHNLALENGSLVLPKYAMVPTALSLGAEDTLFLPGAWIFNHGFNAQSDVQLRAQITHNGSVVYNETSAPNAIPAGDSTWFTLPPYLPEMYSGNYTLGYDIVSNEEDAFPENDNSARACMSGKSSATLMPMPRVCLSAIVSYLQPPTLWASGHVSTSATHMPAGQR